MNEILDESLESKDSGSPSQPLYILPSMSGLSKSQKKIVEERVQAIRSEVPIYVAIMRWSSIGMSRTPVLVSSILFYIHSAIIIHSSGSGYCDLNLVY